MGLTWRALFVLGLIGLGAEVIHGASAARAVLYLVAIAAGIVGLRRKARRA